MARPAWDGFLPSTCSLKGVIEKQSQILLKGGKDQLYSVATVLGERAELSSDLGRGSRVLQPENGRVGRVNEQGLQQSQGSGKFQKSREGAWLL